MSNNLKSGESTLIIPIALLFNAKGALQAIRIVCCKVASTGNVTESSKPGSVSHVANTLPSYMNSISIGDILGYKVRELSMLDGRRVCTSLCEKIIKVLYVPYADEINILGVRAIACIYADGRVENSGVLYPIVSHIGNTMTKFHGFFDYTGAWHAGTADIPNREPYTREFVKLQQAYCCSHCLDRGGALSSFALGELGETLLGCIPVWKETMSKLSVRLPDTMELVRLHEPEVCATSMVAANQLMKNSQLKIEQRGVNCIAQLKGIVRPAILSVPVDVTMLHTMERETRVDSLDAPEKRIVAPVTLRKIEIDYDTVPRIFDSSKLHIQSMSITAQKMKNLDLPASMSGTIIKPETEFYLNVNTVPPNTVGQMLTLSNIMTDPEKVTVSVGGQPWSRVCLPFGRQVSEYTGVQEQENFELIFTQANRLFTTKTKEATRVNLLFDAYLPGPKQTIVNLTAAQSWNMVYLSTQTVLFDKGETWVDGTQNKTLCLLGKANARRDSALSFTCLHTVTSASTTEQINTSSDIPNMICIIKDVPNNVNIYKPGEMHINGNIHELMLVLDTHNAKVAKNIYINGRLDKLSIVATKGSAAVTEAIVKNIRVYVRNKAVLWSAIPFAGTAFKGKGITQQIVDVKVGSQGLPFLVQCGFSNDHLYRTVASNFVDLMLTEMQ